MMLKISPSGEYFWKNKWKKFEDLDKLFVELFGKTQKQLKIKPFELKPGIKRKGKLSKTGKKQTLEIEVTLSPKVARENSKYFEGILQIKNSDDYIVEFVHNELAKQKPKGIFITKQTITKNRADFFITDQTYMKRLAVKLQKEFGGKISLNPKLFSKNRQSGKELYRLTILLELPKLKKNEVIVVDDKLYKISSLQQKINVQDFKGKKTSFPYKDHEVLEKQETRITKTYPEIEVIDPDTYQSMPVKNKNLKKKYKIDQKVKVVFWEGLWILE